MFKERIQRDNTHFKESANKDRMIIVGNLIDSANVIHCSLDTLSKFHGLGFAISVTWKGSEFTRSEAFGDSLEDASKRTAFLHAYSQRCELERLKTSDDELPKHDGAIHIDDLVISVYGAGEMNSAIAIGMAVGAKAISYDKAISLAREYGCLSEYAENVGAMTERFFQ